jgi:hypothetical protein
MDYNLVEIQKIIEYHATKLKKAIQKFNELEPIVRQDPDACLFWEVDENLSTAIAAFEASLEAEPTDIMDALADFLL